MAISILLAMLAPAPMPATATLPSGKWTLEGDNNMCALLHTFGEGGSQITLGIRRWPLGDLNDILLYKPDYRDGVGRGVEQLTFDAGTPVSAPYQSYVVAHKNARMAVATYTDVALAPIESAKEAILMIGAESTVRIALPDMKPALKALRDCNDLLLQKLGVDSAWRAKTATPPYPVENPAHWFSEKDYPSAAKLFYLQGMSRMLLTVGTNGRITQCVTFATSGSAKLDDAACRGSKLKGNFSPARDFQGQPMIGYYVFSLDFKLY